MSSATAMNKHAGGVAEYRSSEGKTVLVPYRGPVAATVQVGTTYQLPPTCHEQAREWRGRVPLLPTAY